MARDKMVTRRKILDAVGRILAREGSSKIGINLIAKEAGIDKVMIYRYFGSLEKLLIAFGEDQQVWPPLELLLKKNTEPPKGNALEIAITGYLVNHLAEFRRDSIAKEITRWSLIDINALTNSISGEREKQCKNLMNQLPFDQNVNPDMDLTAIISLLHAGITQLVLNAKYSDYYMGIDLKSARGWKRIEVALGELIKAYCFQKFARSSD